MPGTSSTSFGHSPHPFSSEHDVHSAHHSMPADWLLTDLNSAHRSTRTSLVSTMSIHRSISRDRTRRSFQRSSVGSSIPAIARAATGPMASPPPPVVAPVFESQIPQPRVTLFYHDPAERSRRKRRTIKSPWDLRHIKAQSPARKGLYTLSEAEEDWEIMKEEMSSKRGFVKNRRPPSPSPLRQHPSPLPLLPSSSTLSEFRTPSSRPISATSTSDETDEILTDSESSFHHVITPRLEEEDPFALDEAWAEDSEASKGQTFLDLSPSRPQKPHRPPPLDLSLSAKCEPESLPRIYQSPGFLPAPGPRTGQTPKVLLSPLPITSAGVFIARRRTANEPPSTPPRPKRRSKEYEWQRRNSQPVEPIDLESALEEFLTCCGEGPSRATSGFTHPSAFSDDSDDQDFFHPRPTPYKQSTQRGDGLMFSAFPLPPSRDTVPARPARDDDMGLGSLSSMARLGLGDVLNLSTERSPVLTTPRTPPSVTQTSALYSPPSIPSPKTCTERQRPPMPSLRGDHSFLQSMSVGDDVSAGRDREWTSRGSSSLSQASVGSYASSSGSTGSAGSSGSRGSTNSSGSLPRRSALPDSWRTYRTGRI